MRSSLSHKAAGHDRTGTRAWAWITKPPAAFALLSAVFGILVVVVTPPLRGPDEAAHFLRAYGIAGGAIVPAMADELGRKGLLLPARVHDDFAFFAEAAARFGGGSFDYVEVFDEYRRLRAERREAPRADRPPVFVHYEGSEGYTPVPYLAHAAAAALARGLGLGFLPTFYLMRVAGLAFMTAVAAYAIARAERLKWAFIAIAMLPSALYGRSVISADGGALAFTLVLTALCLNAARAGGGGRPPERALWLTLAILSKPPHIVFAALEPMTSRFRELPRRWRVLAAVLAPGLILLPAWLLAVSGDMAAWRMIEAMRLPPEEFDPVRKALFLVENPLHFPMLTWATLVEQHHRMWRQLIGVLGWLDTELRPGVHLLLSVVLVTACLDKLDTDKPTRLRIALYGLTVFVGYTLCVYLIFYLTWTPIRAPTIWGVQGRYFVVVLPVLAVLLSALADVRLPRRVAPALAVVGAVVAGAATVEAVARTDFLRAVAEFPFPVHPHMLRHACGFALTHDRHDTRAIEEGLGHKNLQHTTGYTSSPLTASATSGSGRIERRTGCARLARRAARYARGDDGPADRADLRRQHRAPADGPSAGGSKASKAEKTRRPMEKFRGRATRR